MAATRTNTADNAAATDLAALGLDLGADATQVMQTVPTNNPEAGTVVGTDPVTNDPIVATSSGPLVNAGDVQGVPEVAAAVQHREQVEVGDIQIEDGVELGSLTRTSGGSKYPFAKLAAPAKQDDGSFKYASFRVDLQKGVDADKLKRSVQSAATQANRQHKDEGKYFVTRSIVTDGEFAGIRVFRVDNTVAKEN